MKHPIHCYDRPPKNAAYYPVNGAVRIALLKSNLWPNGSQIGVQFSRRTGTADNRRKVMETVEELSEFVNLDFRESSAGDIRISFDPRGGAWSFIGTDALRQPTRQATMNLGFDQAGTYRHEFGHAIGAIHEHQNPRGGIQWNREQVIRDLSGPPNNWDRQTIERNMFQSYSEDQINGTVFDPLSVMLYAIPSSWTMDGFRSNPNERWSQKDKDFLSAQYPGRSGTEAEVAWGLEPIDVSPKVLFDLKNPGEVDLYSFPLNERRRVRVETLGESSLVVRLFGPDSKTRLVSQTDNAGVEDGNRIEEDLSSGVYYVQVSHIEPSGTADYRIRVLLLDDWDRNNVGLPGDLHIKAVCPVDPGSYKIEKL